jgi:hypothetical protein
LVVWLLLRGFLVFVTFSIVSRATAVATTVAAAATAFAALVTAAQAANQAAYYTQYNNGADDDTGNDRPSVIHLLVAVKL